MHLKKKKQETGAQPSKFVIKEFQNGGRQGED